MKNERAFVAFEKYNIRRFYNEQNETWYFSVIDVVAELTDSANPRDYWFKMKTRVKTEDGFELSTICRQLKLTSADGKKYATDCSNAEGLLRIIQSIPSPKAEPFKQWLAKVGYERIQDMGDPARSLNRARILSVISTSATRRNLIERLYLLRLHPHQLEQQSHVRRHDQQSGTQAV
jgi:hypothetical protein